MDIVEPLFVWIVGLGALGLAAAAIAGHIRNHPSAPFFTFAASGLAFAFFAVLPRIRVEVLLICGLTAAAGMLVDRGVHRRLDVGEDTLSRRGR